MADTSPRERRSGTGSLLLFLLLFTVPCAFTYLSGPLLGLALMVEESVGDASYTRTAYLAICYAIMTVACVIRGNTIDRGWLVAFPIVAAVFDIFLAFFPIVPTIMNIFALAMGVPQRSNA